MVVLPFSVTLGCVQVMADGAAILTSAGIRPSETITVLEVTHPVTGCVAVSVNVPMAFTVGFAIAVLDIVPGPVQSNVELTGVTELFRLEVICVQVMGKGAAGKVMTGALRSLATVTEVLTWQ